MRQIERRQLELKELGKDLKEQIKEKSSFYGSVAYGGESLESLQSTSKFSEEVDIKKRAF